MAAFGGLLVGLFLLYFVFMLVAQFLIGQLLIFLGAIYIGYLAYKLCLDLEEPKRIHKIIALLVFGVILVAYVGALNSDSSCDGFYIGKVFKSGYGPEQNGTTITSDNYSSVCGYPGFRHACRQFEECKRGMVVLKPLQLFLFGLLCAALGSVLGLVKVSKFEIKNNAEPKEPIEIADGNKVIVDVSSKNLQDYWKESKDTFETSKVSHISKMTGRSERAIKVFITRNKLFCADYGVREPNQ